MPPTDGSFVPYEPQTTGASTSSSEQAPLVSRSPTNGRIFVLKFASSSQRHLFWLQSAPQGPRGAADPAFLSARDRKIGETVDRLLQGEDVDVNAELAAVARGGSSGGGGGGGRDRGDDDETMEDAPPSTGSDANPHGGAGGAGPDATGGDFREEGEESREGGADGARA